MRWIWDPAKDAANRVKHRLSFEAAKLVFDDPLHASRRDFHDGEVRWQTMGMIGSVVVFVVHTDPIPDPNTGEEIGRIISARMATARERRAYEENDF
jgi:uncharacterized DUF497 family protein